jgi:hypothetical protein
MDFGSGGHFFLYTSWGDVAETPEATALKLGFARTPNYYFLWALLTFDIFSKRILWK